MHFLIRWNTRKCCLRRDWGYYPSMTQFTEVTRKQDNPNSHTAHTHTADTHTCSVFRSSLPRQQFSRWLVSSHFLLLCYAWGRGGGGRGGRGRRFSSKVFHFSRFVVVVSFCLPAKKDKVNEAKPNVTYPPPPISTPKETFSYTSPYLLFLLPFLFSQATLQRLPPPSFLPFAAASFFYCLPPSSTFGI